MNCKTKQTSKSVYVGSNRGKRITNVVRDHSNTSRGGYFYSGAQRACIASYIAEDMYNLDLARAAVAYFCSEIYTFDLSEGIARLFPLLHTSNMSSRVAVFELFGVDPSYMVSAKLQHVVEIMEAIEARDIHGTPSANALVSAPSEIIIADMTAEQSRTALTLRIGELFDTESLDFDTEKSLQFIGVEMSNKVFGS